MVDVRGVEAATRASQQAPRSSANNSREIIQQKLVAHLANSLGALASRYARGWRRERGHCRADLNQVRPVGANW